MGIGFCQQNCEYKDLSKELQNVDRKYSFAYPFTFTIVEKEFALATNRNQISRTHCCLIKNKKKCQELVPEDTTNIIFLHGI